MRELPGARRREPVLGATEEVREFRARLRGGEVPLVLLARQGQDRDHADAEAEGHARAEAVGALGQRGEQEQGRIRIAAREPGQDVGDPRLEAGDVLGAQVAMAAERDDERQHAAAGPVAHRAGVSVFSTR